MGGKQTFAFHQITGIVLVRSSRMRLVLIVSILLGAAGCAATSQPQYAGGRSPIGAAEALIDAFYSFDANRLSAAMANAPGSQPQIIYYQGWAQGGNYAIVERKPCRLGGAGEISCDVTVRDDLIAALRTGYWVTDTFHLTVRDGRIVKVRTSSNDPPDLDQTLNWLKRERPEVMAGPCQGFFAGGPTPQDCVRAVIAGFAAYRAANPRG
jgi:hypothetical protein